MAGRPPSSLLDELGEDLERAGADAEARRPGPGAAQGGQLRDDQPAAPAQRAHDGRPARPRPTPRPWSSTQGSPSRGPMLVVDERDRALRAIAPGGRPGGAGRGGREQEQAQPWREGLTAGSDTLRLTGRRRAYGTVPPSTRLYDDSGEFSMYAVIESGGKQYRVAPGDVIDVELLAAGRARRRGPVRPGPDGLRRQRPAARQPGDRGRRGDRLPGRRGARPEDPGVQEEEAQEVPAHDRATGRTCTGSASTRSSCRPAARDRPQERTSSWHIKKDRAPAATAATPTRSTWASRPSAASR